MPGNAKAEQQQRFVEMIVDHLQRQNWKFEGGPVGKRGSRLTAGYYEIELNRLLEYSSSRSVHRKSLRI